MDLLVKYGILSLSAGGIIPEGWTYGKKLIISANSIDATLPNHIVPVYLNNTNFDFSKAKTLGEDIRFCTYDGENFTFLKFEKVQYSNVSEFAKFNVLLPIVSDLVDTEFYMFYGNPNAYNTSIESWRDMTGKDIVYNGNVKLVPNVAKFGKAGYFDGTGDYILVPSHADFNIGAGNFKFGMTIQPTSLSASMIIFDMRSSGTSVHPCLYIDGSTKKLNYFTGGSTRITSSTVLEVGKKYDIELNRVDGVTRLFINGIQEGSNYSDTNNYGQNQLIIGSEWDYISGFVGYIDDFILQVGIGGHTSNFTPPQEPYTVDEYTKLLLHFDSAPFTDETGKAVTTYGNVTPIKTAYADGARSVYLDGNGDYFSFVQPSEFDFMHIPNAKWTAKFKYHAVDFAQRQTLFSSCATGVTSEVGVFITLETTRGFVVGIHNANASRVFLYTSTTGIYPNDIFEHDIEVTCDLSVSSNCVKIFIDGLLVATGGTIVTTPVSTSCAVAYIGNVGGVYLKGYLSRIHFSNIVRHTASFTVSDSDFVYDQYTKLLWNFDTIYPQEYAQVYHLNDRVVDATGNYGNIGITTSGTTIVNTSLGSVRQFNGTSDGITLPLQNTTDNITMTVMATKVGTGGTDALFYTGTNGSNGYGIFTNSLKFSLKATSSYADTLVNISTTPQVVVLRRTNGVWSAMINGVIYAVTNLSVSTPTGSMYLGRSSGTDWFDGQLSNARYCTVARSDAFAKAESLGLKNELVTITDV